VQRLTYAGIAAEQIASEHQQVVELQHPGRPPVMGRLQHLARQPRRDIAKASVADLRDDDRHESNHRFGLAPDILYWCPPLRLLADPPDRDRGDLIEHGQCRVVVIEMLRHLNAKVGKDGEPRKQLVAIVFALPSQRTDFVDLAPHVLEVRAGCCVNLVGRHAVGDEIPVLAQQDCERTYVL